MGRLSTPHSSCLLGLTTWKQLASHTPTLLHCSGLYLSWNRTDMGKELKYPVGKQGRQVAVVQHGLPSHLPGGSWMRPRDHGVLHTLAFSASGGSPCPSGDSDIIWVMHRVSSHPAELFPAVASSDPLNTVRGASQPHRGRHWNWERSSALPMKCLGESSAPHFFSQTHLESSPNCTLLRADELGGMIWACWAPCLHACLAPLPAPFSFPSWGLGRTVCPEPRVATWPSPLQLAVCHCLSRRLTVTGGWCVSLWSGQAGILLLAVLDDISQIHFLKNQKIRSG